MSNSYYKFPSSIKFLNYKEIFLNGNLNYPSELTSYAEYLSSNIQKQIWAHPYLTSEILFFNNSIIINQINFIIIEGKYYNEYSKKAYLIFNKKNDNDIDIPCIMEKKIGPINETYFLKSKPHTSFEGNLNFAAVNLTDINKIIYLYFSENNPYVNFIYQIQRVYLLE